MIGVAANGIYAMANKYSLILAVAYSVLNLSWSQSISKHIDEKDNFVSDVCNITVRVFGSLGLIMIAFLPLVFSKLFTDSYGDAYYYIPILVLSNVFLSIAGIYSGIYIAKNLTRQIAKTTIAASVINIVVNLSLISFIGVYAAAISTFAAYLLLAIYRHYDTKKYVGIAYNIRVLVFLFVMYTIVTMLYYANNDIGNIASILIALTATFVLNGSIVRAMKDKILSFTSRKSISVDSNYGIKEEVS
jgi:O-antigen/teichoic acid export membrane protein